MEPSKCARDCQAPDEGKKDCCDDSCLVNLATRTCLEDGCAEAQPLDDPEPEGGCANQGESGTGCCTTSPCTKVKEESIIDSCCASEPVIAGKATIDSCCASEPVIAGKATINSCCAPEPEPATAGKSALIEEECKDTKDGYAERSCCAPEPASAGKATPIEEECKDKQDGCCAKDNSDKITGGGGVTVSGVPTSSCRKRRSGSTVPKTSAGKEQEKLSDGCCKGKKRAAPEKRPCKKHLNEARQKFGDTLEALGCICRALLARNLESCCTTQSRPSSPRPKPRSSSVRPNRSSLRSVSTQREEKIKARGCCSAGKCSDSKEATEITVSTEISISAGSIRSAKTGCGSSTDTCCKPKIIEKVQSDNCCGDDDDDRISFKKSPSIKLKSSDIDIEKAVPTVSERVVLSVAGMTCVGCEKKLYRTLDSLTQVHNLQTSLVMNQAEFDLDPTISSVEETIRHLEKTTEFKYERLSSKGQYLDLVRTNIDQLIEQSPQMKGVLGASKLNKRTMRVEYDPLLVGARDLIANFGDDQIQLAPLQPSPALAAGNKHLRETGWMTLFSAALTIPILVLAWAPLPDHGLAYSIVSLILATLVQVIVAGPFYPSALKALIFTRVIEMDLLIVLSTTTAYVFSVVSFGFETAGKPLATGDFFETSALLVTLIMVGRYISALARQRAVESISVRSLQATTAFLVQPDGITVTEIDIRLLQYGDVFKVMPDSRITTDGVVISGHSEVDESMITGEALPLEKTKHSPVIAGSINNSGTLKVRLSRLPDDNTISEIANMVDKAKYSKPKAQDTADLIASYFVPFIVVLAIVTFCIWIAISIKIRNEKPSTAVVNSITYAIAVLIVSCPCALGLAIPMVVVIAGGVAAKHGVVFKSASMIEIARSVNHVVFDKTGTLTQGKMAVVKEEYINYTEKAASSLILGMTSDIKHPVSVALAKHMLEKGAQAGSIHVQDLKTIPGKGLQCFWNEKTVCVGNSRWLSLEDDVRVKSLLANNLTALCVTVEGELIAIFGLQDQLRPDAQHVVSELTKRGITVSLVSGDDHGAVQSVATNLGIQPANVKSRCSPADKQAYLKSLRASSTSSGAPAAKSIVLFCGDGTNDAVALAEADIGVHINEGTDVAQSAADVVLMRPVLGGIVTLINLSKASYRRIIFNFTWAFVYNFFAVLLAGGAFVNARIPPEYAGLGEIVSVLPLVAIAWGLKWAKI